MEALPTLSPLVIEQPLLKGMFVLSMFFVVILLRGWGWWSLRGNAANRHAWILRKEQILGCAKSLTWNITVL